MPNTEKLAALGTALDAAKATLAAKTKPAPAKAAAKAKAEARTKKAADLKTADNTKFVEGASADAYVVRTVRGELVGKVVNGKMTFAFPTREAADVSNFPFYKVTGLYLCSHKNRQDAEADKALNRMRSLWKQKDAAGWVQPKGEDWSAVRPAKVPAEKITKVLETAGYSK